METAVKTPMQIFSLPQQLVVPPSSGRTCGTRPSSGCRLWQDVRRLAELRLRDPFSPATHFLGAVVVQAQDDQLGNLPARNIIDGQQRLTTLQLLMDAAASVLEAAGSTRCAASSRASPTTWRLYVRPARPGSSCATPTGTAPRSTR